MYSSHFADWTEQGRFNGRGENDKKKNYPSMISCYHSMHFLFLFIGREPTT